jgi:hypothetical protein
VYASLVAARSLHACELRRRGRLGLEVVAVRQHDGLDRVGADEQDLHVPIVGSGLLSTS